MQGYANIAFAGGRDTIINTVSTIFGYLGEHPEALAAIRENPKTVITATEELIRFASPVTHLGRMCPVNTDVHGTEVKAGNLVSLNWAAANFDESVFENPEEVNIERQPNPHIAFGNGAHNCLGAPHARLPVRTLLTKLSEMASSVTVIEAEGKIEKEGSYERANAYHTLTVKLKAN